MDRLIEASEMGNIDVLYEVIEEDADVLRRIDEIMFVNTPLHISASAGRTAFAMEMMNLMPSFARKLNKSGLSPMHLALVEGHLELVLLFLEVDSGLVRVKGREGLTPLHFAISNGNIDLLAKFLVACPKSIEDLTVHGETAFHVAVKYNGLEALEVLVRWFQRICHEDASKWKVEIPNRKNSQGKTVLDVALTSDDNRNELAMLLSEINAKNSEELTHDKMIITNYIKSKPSRCERFAVSITRHKMKLSDNARNALLVVLGLLVAASFPAAYSPPGSVHQDDDNNVPIAVINGTSYNFNHKTAPGKPSSLPGTVVINPVAFLYFSICNTIVVYGSICLTCLLLPDGFLATIMTGLLMFYLLHCYSASIIIISPAVPMVQIVNSVIFIILIFTVFTIVQIHRKGKNKLRNRFCYTTD